MLSLRESVSLPHRILVVDDETDILDIVTSVLQKQGYHVSGANDGEQALQMAELETSDLVLLDIVMPGKSGLEICKILKAQPRTRHLQVIMLSALNRDVDRKMITEVGADGHIVKPFAIEDLAREIGQFLKKAEKDKFSRRLGLAHKDLRGTPILLEYDAS